jgi:hypothetical protein
VSAAQAAEDDATTAIARERFKEGVQYFDQKQYDKSRAAFLQAYALKRHPAVLLNLAQSELRAGYEADAAKHFSQFLREAKDATEAERSSAEAGLASAKTEVAEVAVHVDEEGAVVSVDGSTEGQAPLPGPVYLTPGSHTITAKKESRETSVQLNAVAGQATSTNLRFKKTGAAPLPAAQEKSGSEAAPPPAESETTQPPSGEPSAGPSSEPIRERQPFLQWATTSPVAMVGGAVAVLGIGSGIGFGFASKKSYDNADSVAAQIRDAVAFDAIELAQQGRPGFNSEGICSNPAKQNETSRPEKYKQACKKYSDNVSSGDDYKTISIVSWAVAGVAVAGTVIAYVLDGSGPTESAARRPHKLRATVSPWLTGSQRGLFVTGTF